MSMPGLRSFQLFSLAFGVAVGIGWIVVVGQWLTSAGPLGAATAFVLAGIFTLAIGHSYARVAIAYPLAGGEFAYARESLGLSSGFWVGWFLALAYVVVIAFEIVSLAWIARELFPFLPRADASPIIGIDLPGLAIGFTALVGVVILNRMGGHAAARVQDVLVVAKVLVSTALLLLAVRFGTIGNLQPVWGGHEANMTLEGIVAVLATAPFFYAGFGVIAQAISDVQRPRTIERLPLVLSAVILATMAFYVLIIFAVAAAAPREQTIQASMPAAAAFALAVKGHWGAMTVLLLGLLGLLTIMNGLFFAAVRLLHAIASHGLIPIAFARSGPSGISGTSVMFTGLATAVMASLGQPVLVPLLNVASSSIAAVMAVVCVIAAYLSRTASRGRSAAFISTVGILLGCFMALLPLYQAWRGRGWVVPVEWLAIGGWLAVGLLLRKLKPGTSDANEHGHGVASSGSKAIHREELLGGHE